jgi:chorismate mutase
MAIRGIRGATVVTKDDSEEILSQTQQLLAAIIEANPGLNPGDIESALFSVTSDLSAAFPAKAARCLGWNLVPMMCFQEIPVKGSLPLCIRVLIHWNTDLTQDQVRHVYIGEAKTLRPDLES